MEQVVIQFSADISKLLPAIEAFEKVGLIDKKNGDIFRTTSAEYSKRNQVLDQTIAKNKELDKTISSGAVEAHTKQIKEGTKAIQQNTEQTENLNKKLKEMQKELINLEASGQQNTKRFKELTKEAAELRDTIGDAKERIKAFSSDTRRLDAVAQSFKLVAASAAAMQGAFALFGSENAELQKTMMKLQGAMALLAGVQEIAAFATGQSYLKTVLLDGAQKLVAVSAQAMGVSVGTATAILTGGVTVIIGAIAAYVMFGDETEKLTDTINKQATALQKQKDAYKDTEQAARDAMIEFKFVNGEMTKSQYENEKLQNQQLGRREAKEKEHFEARKEAINEYVKSITKTQKEADELLTKIELDGNKVRIKGSVNRYDIAVDQADRINAKLSKLQKEQNKELIKLDETFATEKATLNKNLSNAEIEDNKRKIEKKKSDDKTAAEAAYQIQLQNLRMQMENDAAFEQSMKHRAKIQYDWNRTAEEVDAMYFELYQTGLYKTSEEIYNEIEKRLKANADYYNKLLTDDAAANKQLAANAKTQTEIQVQYKKSQEDIDAMYAKIATENAQLTSDQIYAIIKKQLDDEVKAKEDAIKLKQQLEDAAKQQALKIAGELASFQEKVATERMEREFDKKIQLLEAEKDAVLSNQNLTESQREATEKLFEERRKKLMIQKWKAEQQVAINSAIINTALAIGNAIATTKPFPAAVIAAAGAAVTGAIQVAKIRSTPIPQFAEGTEFLEGAGTGTSDSIPAMLSRGERVVPAKTNKDYFDGLSVIQNRLVAPELVNTLLTNLAENGGMLAAPTEAITQLEQQFGIDYARLGKEFQKGRTQVSINIDEKGFTKHIQQGLNRSTYHNQKFRFKQ